MGVSFILLSSDDMDVPLDKEIPLEKAVLLIKKQNNIAQQENQPMSCTYCLVQDGQEMYRSFCTFPKHSFDLFEQIVEEIESQDIEQKELVLSWMSQAFNRKVAKPKKKKKGEKAKKEKHSFRFSNRWLLSACIAFIGCFCVGMGVYVLGNQTVERPTLEELLNEELFMEAGKEYSTEHETIEDTLFKLVRTTDVAYVQRLKEFNQTYPTIQGVFDLAILQYDYEQAIEQYENNFAHFTNDRYRIALVGYAYLKIDQLDQAKERLNECKDAELEKMILEYEQASLIIKEKQKEIEELQKKPSENKKKIEQAIEELYEAKEKLTQF